MKTVFSINRESYSHLIIASFSSVVLPPMFFEILDFTDLVFAIRAHFVERINNMNQCK